MTKTLGPKLGCQPVNRSLYRFISKKPLQKKIYFLATWHCFLFLFFYFSFPTSLFLLLKHFFLKKRRDDAYIFKGRAQMPKTMMPEELRKLTCRYPPKMLHQWKKKNEHGRYPLASVNEIAKSDGTKILDIFGAFFGRHFSSRPPGFHRTVLGRHVFQTVRCWSQEAEDVA